MTHYLRLWLASLRYSVVRSLMFRFDFLLWCAVEIAWMSVNVMVIKIVYRHTQSIAGWSEYEMMLLVGTSMLLQRLLMGFFWTNLFEIGRNVRSGNFDFYLTQPGQPLFMVSTRKLDLDALANSFVAVSVVVFSTWKLHLAVTVGGVLIYAALIALGVVIHYSLLLAVVSSTFWIVKTEGIEGSYFTVAESGRLPREAYVNLITRVVFVYFLPMVIVTNVPANHLLGRLDWVQVLWLAGFSMISFAVAATIFHRGLRRYTSASS